MFTVKNIIEAGLVIVSSIISYQVKDCPPLRVVHRGRAVEGAQQEGHAAGHGYDLKTLAPAK